MEEMQIAEVGSFCWNEACEDYQKVHHALIHWGSVPCARGKLSWSLQLSAETMVSISTRGLSTPLCFLIMVVLYIHCFLPTKKLNVHLHQSLLYSQASFFTAILAAFALNALSTAIGPVPPAGKGAAQAGSLVHKAETADNRVAQAGGFAHKAETAGNKVVLGQLVAMAGNRAAQADGLAHKAETAGNKAVLGQLVTMAGNRAAQAGGLVHRAEMAGNKVALDQLVAAVR